MTQLVEGTPLVEAIKWLAAERPDQVGYVHVAQDGAEQTLTWSWLERRSNQLAGAMRERGVGPGDNVALGFRNSPHFVMSVVATWKLGAIPVPMRFDLPDWEVERVRAVIDPVLHISEKDIAWIDSTESLELPEVDVAISPHVQGICSSGSTGTPKIILSALPAVLSSAYAMPLAELWGPVQRPQTILVLAPMYHVNAFATLHCMLAGDTLVVLEKFDAQRAVDVIERHKVTHFTATPTMLQRIADIPGVDDRNLSSLVWVLQGAAPMPQSLVHRWSDLIGAERLIMAYGMTEGLGLTILRGDEYMQHLGSVGKPMPGTEVKVLDTEGNELPAGTIGDLYMKSSTNAGSTYLGDVPQLTRTAEGFATVGDMGYVDEQGFVFLVDRRVDMIISGGANVFPAEVEAALIDHPQVADVVVIGLKDAEWGRRVHALVEPTDASAPPTEAELIAYAKGRLAPYKVPKAVEFVDAIPRSEATKVNRGRLVEVRGG